jgi:hypothetical protein
MVTATTIILPPVSRLSDNGSGRLDVLPARVVLPVFRAVRLVRRRATPGAGKVHEPGIV